MVCKQTLFENGALSVFMVRGQRPGAFLEGRPAGECGECGVPDNPIAERFRNELRIEIRLLKSRTFGLGNDIDPTGSVNS